MDSRHDPPRPTAGTAASGSGHAALGTAYGSVGSRFVSHDAIVEAQQKKEEAIKEVYARIGQEPPPQAAEEVYDPRTLYERLQAQKDAKQEKFDEKMKLSNQFRGIDEEESSFLADVQAEKRAEERAKREAEQKELQEFRKHAQRTSPPPPLLGGSPPAPIASASASAQPDAASAVALKKSGKRKREGLLGVVRKKPATGTAAAAAKTDTSTEAKGTPEVAQGKHDKSVDGR